jgi:hypothetical protein
MTQKMNQGYDKNIDGTIIVQEHPNHGNANER